MSSNSPTTPLKGGMASPATDKKIPNYIPDPPSELATIQGTLSTIQSELRTLETSFDSLGEQTLQSASPSDESAIAKQLAGFRKRVQKHNGVQENEIQKIKDLLQEVLAKDVLQQLRQEVEQEVAQMIEVQVQKLVTDELRNHVSKELQDELESYKRQIEETERALLNSENRIVNAKVGSSTEPLRPIYKSNGQLSTVYPGNLAELWAMEDDRVKQLVDEYEPLDVSETRDRNLNKFMYFIGVSYQMVPGSATIPGRSSIPMRVNSPL